MAFLFYMFSCQLVLVTIYGSDKHLKDVPKIDQGIDTGNENETDTVTVVVPQVNYCSDGAQVVICDNNGNASLDTLQDRHVEDGHSTQRQDHTENVPDDESKNFDTLETKDQTDEKVIEKIDTDMFDRSDNTNVVDTPVEDTVPRGISVESPPESIYNADSNDDGAELEEYEASQLDPNNAGVSISDLRSAVYQRLGDALERNNKYDGDGPWWNYLVLHLDISRKEQREIERSRRPGVEFLDKLEERGFTLRQLENLFMRFQMHDALRILRSHQMDVIGRENNGRSTPAHNKEGEEKSGVQNVDRSVDNEKDTSGTSYENGNEAVNRQEGAFIDQVKDTTEADAKMQNSEGNHCMPNPCRKGGTCITDEDGYTFTCKCASKWISGKNCEKDDGPCRNNDCDIEGTRSCVYTGYDVQSFICHCNVGYDGEKCETKHPYSDNPAVRNVLDSCNERGLSQNECIAFSMDIDVTGKTEEEVVNEARKKDVIDIFGTLISKLFNNGKQASVFSDFLETLTNKGGIEKVGTGLNNVLLIDQKPVHKFDDGSDGDGDAKVKGVIDEYKKKFNLL